MKEINDYYDLFFRCRVQAGIVRLEGEKERARER
jgi:hypothetical protein